MDTLDLKREPRVVAEVDQLIDENGQPMPLPEATEIKATHVVENAVGGTGPSAWWRVGLIAIAIVAAILLVLQLLAGNPGTEMVPGTPTAAPQQQTTTQ